MSQTYPIHGFARPVRLRYPLGNAFAQQQERQRRNDLTAYQYNMAAQRQYAAHHYHAACHQDEAHRRRPFTPTGHQSDQAYAESPTALGRPVSSWSFINNNNNNTFKGTLESSQQSEPLPAYGSAAAQLALQELLLPEDDPLIANIPEVDHTPEVDYSQLQRILAQLHLEFDMSKRDRDAAFPQASPSSELTRARRAERAQQALQDLASNYKMDRRTEVTHQALPRPGDLSSESNVSHRTDRNPTDLVDPGGPSSESNVSRRTEVNQQALPRHRDLPSESNVSGCTNCNCSTPLRFDDNSAEFTPRSTEHKQPTFLPPGDPRRINRINHDLLRPRDLTYDGTKPRHHEFNQPISVRAGIMSAGSESELVMPSRLDRNLPALPRPDDQSTNFILPQRIDSIQPTLPSSGIQSPESKAGIPRRPERNQLALDRPDSEVSEVLMPRRTPPARFAALTSQHTAPMPAHLSTATGRTNVTAQNHYVKKAAGNDAMVMSTGPMIPTRDGSCEFAFYTSVPFDMLTILYRCSYWHG
jgi:hypothetical protein